MSEHPNKPHRLSQVFQSYAAPVYFVTFCTADRKPILANEAVHCAFRDYAEKAEQRGIATMCPICLVSLRKAAKGSVKVNDLSDTLAKAYGV